jgi:hypothetical protein
MNSVRCDVSFMCSKTIEVAFDLRCEVNTVHLVEVKQKQEKSLKSVDEFRLRRQLRVPRWKATGTAMYKNNQMLG